MCLEQSILSILSAGNIVLLAASYSETYLLSFSVFYNLSVAMHYHQMTINKARNLAQLCHSDYVILRIEIVLNDCL